ncbi:MAG TPA: HepT-like ribonuclease domain-containing protein [Thermoanaerobaculia bacterium]|nr:HepT-like ribonuclease domain-containing protein [Thermoanaerobaculia bacterium]
MSKRYDVVALGDMLDAAREIQQILLGMDRDIFDMERPYQLSVLHLLQTIGEAANRIHDDWRREHPEIDWPNIIGMRNRIVHDYRHINFDRVWEIATIEVPRLIAALKLSIPSDPP